jgi:spermidine dehydrogenase
MSKLHITRRDFLGGVALGVTAGSALSPLELLAKDGRYPPALTGLRGSHPGSFEVAHAVSWAGAQWPRPDAQTDADYDLIVVGGGLSGLAAAFLYQQRSGGGKRVLVLDNHDDFGGHARRNEFDVDGRHLIGYGGSQSIDSPARYSEASSQLLKDIGVVTDRFYEYFDRDFFRDRELGRGIYFSRDRYGADSLQPNALRFYGDGGAAELEQLLAGYPIPNEAREDFVRLRFGTADYLPDQSVQEKVTALRGMSYTDFLRKHARMHEAVVLMLRDSPKGWWGVGYDAISALEAYRMGMPGFDGMALPEEDSGPAGRDEPYIFHFPDGNAGVARSFVRRLIPEAVPGRTMEDLVLARVDYDLLDVKGSNNRIRLDSTAVDVRHTPDEKHVDVTYVRHGKAERVRGKHVVLACYNRIVPHICAEVPEEQVEAINTNVKIPLVYISIAVRNWKAFENLGMSNISIPQPALMHSFGMDFPVSMGGYDFTRRADEPTVIHGTYVPTIPDQGLSAREQNRQGRRALYELAFDDFEDNIVSVMDGALSGGGFDAGRDIAAITVNRWPHGYSWEYNDLWDPPEWNPNNGPHLSGAAQIGRISIANSDASAYAFVNGAFDAADRAVNEQLGVS